MEILFTDGETRNYPRAVISVGRSNSSDFILTSVTQKRSEQIAVNHHYDDYKIGIKNKIIEPYKFSGIVIDTKNTTWETQFIENYKNLWRASVCLGSQDKSAQRKDTYVSVVYKGIQINGYMVDMSIMSNNTGLSYFSFTLIPLGNPVENLAGEIDYIDKADISNVQREDNKASIFMSNKPIEEQPMREFSLQSINKYFLEKYQFTGVYGGITSFGSYPDTYIFGLILPDTKESVIVEGVEYSWKHLFNKYYREKWSVKNLYRDQKVHIVYKNRVATGYIMSLTDNVKAGETFSRVELRMLVKSDYADMGGH